jgi:4-hydroxybenzoate polyprenyltransferase
MTVRLALAFVFLLCVSGFGLAATINHMAIVEAVNSKLPTAEQFGELGWGPLKSLKLSKEYRRLYPDGKLLRREGILAAASLFSIVVAGGLFGLPLLGVAFVGGVGALSLWLSYFKKRPLSN